MNAVAAPGTLQAPPGHCELLVHELPGHCEATVHGAPTFVPPAQVKLQAVPLLVPPMHRRPPHTVAPTATQSALVKHGVAARLLQVSQRHFAVVKPGARQFGLCLLGTALGGLVGLVGFFPSVRRLAARLTPMDPDSFIHAAALAIGGTSLLLKLPCQTIRP